MLAYGWRTAFVALAAISLLLIVIGAWFFRDRPRDHWLTNRAEVAMLDRDTSMMAEARAIGLVR